MFVVPFPRQMEYNYYLDGPGHGGGGERESGATIRGGEAIIQNFM